MAQNKFEIDLVYLWVDGNDPVWLAKKMSATGEFHDDSETDCRARYEDNDELKYSLRSAEKFAPWIRRIFIVTDNQTPAWLDTSNPKIQIVDHREILPSEALPCFNASVIEYFLYRIPGLGERFLFSNDDMLFGAPLSPDFFFDPRDGNPVVRLYRKRFGRLRWRIKLMLKRGVGHYRTLIVRSAQLVEGVTGRYCSGIPHHNIDAYKKEDYRTVVEDIFAGEVKRSQLNHVRTYGDFHRSAILFWALAAGRAHLKYVDKRTSLRMLATNPDFAGTFSRRSPLLFCLNDIQNTTEADHARIKPFLESLFPVKSAFEL